MILLVWIPCFHYILSLAKPAWFRKVVCLWENFLPFDFRSILSLFSTFNHHKVIPVNQSIGIYDFYVTFSNLSSMCATCILYLVWLFSTKNLIIYYILRNSRKFWLKISLVILLKDEWSWDMVLEDDWLWDIINPTNQLSWPIWLDVLYS